MKKHGFTLIEVIGVVLIMSLLTLLILPPIVNQLSSKKREISEASLQLIYDATDLYVKERESIYPLMLGRTYCVSLETLVNDGKLKNPLKDLSSGKEIPLNKIVKVSVNKYEEGEYSLANLEDVKCDLEVPTVKVSVSGKTATITLSSKVGVVGFATTEERKVPEEWEPITETESTEFTRTFDKEATYYAWVKDKEGNINYTQFKIRESTSSTSYIYGIKRNINTSSTEWERIENSVGLEVNAQIGTTVVRNDFDNIYPWSEIKTYNYNTTTKQITAWIGDANFKFDGTNGEVLTKIPEFYWKREQKDGYEYIYISRDAIEGYTKSEEFSVGRYLMSGSSAGAHSVSGVQPFTNQTVTQFRTYARNLGTGFGQMDWHYFILQMLYLVEYADYNSQAKLGLGNTSNTVLISSGGCNDLGMKSGTLNNDGKHSVIYRGIEDMYGNAWQFVDGINVKDHKVYICYDQSEYAVDTFSGDCYKPIGYTNATENGYSSKIGYDATHPLVAFPIAIGGSSNTYMSDYYHTGSGSRIVLIGEAGATTQSGLWAWNLNAPTAHIHAYVGARLIKIG